MVWDSLTSQLDTAWFDYNQAYYISVGNNLTFSLSNLQVVLHSKVAADFTPFKWVSSWILFTVYRSPDKLGEMEDGGWMMV